MRTAVLLGAALAPLASFAADTPPADLKAWRYERTITLDTTAAGAGVAGDVKGYPLALTFDAASFDFSQAKDDGGDLRFARPDGTPLPHVVESWDRAGKSGAVWVKLDVKGNDDTQGLVVYWGNAQAPAASDSSAVFDTKDGFIGVWHLDEDGNVQEDGYKDATRNAAHGTGVNLKAGSRVDARVGKGTLLRYADQQWIKLENDKRKLFDVTRNVTFSIWAKADGFLNRGEDKSTPGYETMMAKGDNSWRLQTFGVPEWHKPPAELLEICVEKDPKGDLCVVGKTDMKTGTWYHFVGVHDHPQAKLYVNGVLEKADTFDVPWSSGDHPVGLGNQSQWPVKAGRFWHGVLDEARVMGVSKDEHWVKLEYESQREGQKLVRLGKARKR